MTQEIADKSIRTKLIKDIQPLSNLVKGGFMPTVLSSYKFVSKGNLRDLRDTVMNINLRLFDPDLTAAEAAALRVQIRKIKQWLRTNKPHEWSNVTRDDAKLAVFKREIKKMKKPKLDMKDSYFQGLMERKIILQNQINELNKQKRINNKHIKGVNTVKGRIWRTIREDPRESTPTYDDLIGGPIAIPQSKRKTRVTKKSKVIEHLEPGNDPMDADKHELPDKPDVSLDDHPDVTLDEQPAEKDAPTGIPKKRKKTIGAGLSSIYIDPDLLQRMAVSREIMPPRYPPGNRRPEGGYPSVSDKFYNKTTAVSVNPAQMYLNTGGALDWKERNPRFAEFVEAVRQYRAEHPEVPKREVLHIVKKMR